MKKIKSGIALFLVCSLLALFVPAVAAAGVDITDKFTDPNFKAAIYQTIGKTAPDPIYDSDVNGITKLDVIFKNISDLSGIEYLTALTNFGCEYTQLTTLDVSKNTTLTYLECYKNKLITLDVSQNTALTDLYCSNNPVKYL